MNKNKEFTPLTVIPMLSGSLTLTGYDDKQIQQGGQQIPVVDIITIKTEPLQITTGLPGRISAYRITEVRPQVSGVILKHNFKEGSDIEVGVPLYQIDPATCQVTCDSTKGDLAKAQAAVNIAQLAANRYQKLLGTQHISKQEYDQTLADTQRTNTAVTAAEAAVETARINLAYTKVISPISGHIDKSNVAEGALVQNGQAVALATVQQLDPIYADVTQSSNDFLHLKQELANGILKQENGKAKVSLITSDGIKFPQDGTPELSDATADQTIGSTTLCVTSPNPDHTLPPDMFAYARFEEGLSPNTVLVPQRGVARTPRGDTTVLIVGADDRVETRPVVASQAIDDKWLMTEGLKAGDHVVISRLQKVHPGVQVRAQEVTADNNQ